MISIHLLMPFFRSLTCRCESEPLDLWNDRQSFFMDKIKDIIRAINDVFERYGWREDQEQALEDAGLSRIMFLYPPDMKTRYSSESDEMIYQGKDILLWLEYITCSFMIYAREHGDPDNCGFLLDQSTLLGEDGEYKLFANKIQDLVVLEHVPSTEKTIYKLKERNDM